MEVSEALLKVSKDLEEHDKNLHKRLSRVYGSKNEKLIKICIIG